MPGSGLGSLWTRVLREIDDRIVKALADIGAIGGSIDASHLSGQVNPSVVQVERLGPVVVAASENLSAGDLVDVWNDDGTAKARQADASSGRAADGFVTAAVTSGNNARVFQGGLNDQVSGVAPGQTIYLSTTAGGLTTSPPTGSGELVQQVGVGASSTSIVFQSKVSVLLN